ncbi:MAG: polynucleotide adenylyltransferase PcnB [Gammaproteobacteria bacterium]|nr:polynucleotide adenylyltransferase PcnB [Gammaproteobacteria bacterium]
MIKKDSKSQAEPIEISGDAHHISSDDISDHALKVIRRLREAEFDAYLVGGGVRDLLLGRKPKDFDVATNALPEQANKQFRNSRLIGRRFRLLHVHFGREIIEVATFRGHHKEMDDEDAGHGVVRDGMIVRDNVYGSMYEDAWRRDFTVNALYFCPRDNKLVDYTGGFEDLQARLLRMIGDPEQRYMEDPVRMLRAARFAAKLDFNLHPDTEAPLIRLASRLSAVPAARLFEEVLKLFLSGHGEKTFTLMLSYQLFEPLFPLTQPFLHDASSVAYQMVLKGLRNTDARVAAGKPVTPAFLFAIMLWPALLEQVEKHLNKGMNEPHAYQVSANEIFSRQAASVAVPKRFAIQAKEIWLLQPKLIQRMRKRIFPLLDNPRFRAAYDFMLLRAEAGESELQPIGDWWTKIQEEPKPAQLAMVQELQPHHGRKSRRSRKPKHRKTSTH